MYHIKTGNVRPRNLWGDGKLIRKRRKPTHPKGSKSEPMTKRFKLNSDGIQVSLDQESEGEDVVVDQGEGSSAPLHQHQQHQHAALESQQDQQHDHGLEDVVGHEEFRATLGMDGLGEMINGFTDHDHDHDHDHQNNEVAQHVVNVFGSVE